MLHTISLHTRHGSQYALVYTLWFLTASHGTHSHTQCSARMHSVTRITHASLFTFALLFRVTFWLKLKQVFHL